MLYTTPFFTVYILILTAVLGLVMGSFLNCCALRIVHGESLKGRSHCPACGHTLAVKDLVPVFSWLFLKGKCRYCGAKVAVRYLLAELTAMAAFLSIVLRYSDLNPETLEFLGLAALLLAVSFCDIEDYLIPDRFLLLGIGWRILFIALSGSVWTTALQSLIGGLSISLPLLVIVLIMDKVLKKESMGGGDIKLLFMAGLYFVWYENILAILAACLFGLAFALISMRSGRTEEGKAIPFGPAIACGYWLTALFAQPILTAYFSLF